MPRQARNAHADRADPAPAVAASAGGGGVVNDELFLEPMMGTPLAVYIDKGVAERDQLVELVTQQGGQVSPSYSGVPYILVDPETEAGKNLYRQYAGKKGKMILSYRWIHECIHANELQTYHTNWAGCRVTGEEPIRTRSAPNRSSIPVSQMTPAPQRVPQAQARVEQHQQLQPPSQVPLQQQPPPPHQPPPTSSQHQLQHQAQLTQSQPQAHPGHATANYQTIQSTQPPIIAPGTPLGATAFPYAVYPNQTHAPRTSLTPAGAPPQSWQTAMTPHQQHMQMMPARSQHQYAREDQWTESSPSFVQLAETHLPPMNEAHAAAYYDQRYRDGQQTWATAGHDYYDQSQSYETPYDHEQYVPIAGTSGTGLEQAVPLPPEDATGSGQESMPVQESAPVPPTVPPSPVPEEEVRGRRRSRVQPQPAPPPSSLVLNRRNPPVRSPTPPTRVIKSTYGGNLFTADDIEYLKKYIDYCQEQGLVFSLREICERVALKAPHHTFYSWRRYCNKHQIRLGGYAMDVDSRSSSPDGQEIEQGLGPENGEAPPQSSGDTLFTIEAAVRMYQERGLRTRSPTPPRALYRSTTGKGIAFTSEDITFLCKFLAHRKLQNRLDMVSFWKDVATKAPHHSRASWMKYYRRHKHELHRVEADDPRPPPPPKKVRYGKNDDILLAQYFATRPAGTSDKIFQEFAKHYPHHPWKGWQEHHRIHRAKIDHLIQRINNGEVLRPDPNDDEMI